MKNFLKNQTKPQFKLSIFREGMRQLKLPGIIYTIMLFIVTAIICSNSYYNGDFQKSYILPDSIKMYFCETIYFAALLSSVFIVCTMFYISQFMRSGRARDFYCSTPNSVGTVLISYTGSVYAWAFIGLAASYLIQTVIMMFNDAKTFLSCMIAFAGNAVFALMILGIIMVAVTLSGRVINVICTALGTALMPSAVWAAFNGAFNCYYDFFEFVGHSNNVNCPDPIFIICGHLGLINIYGAVESYDDFYILELFTNGRTILFCLVMSAVYIAVSVLFASIRTGDSVGAPFVNNAAHFLSLTLIVCPAYCFAASLLPSILQSNIFDYRNTILDYIITIVEFVIAFIVGFWVCELLLTFDIKHSHRAYKYFPAPVAIALAITGLGLLCSNAEFKTTVDRADVESFSLVRNVNIPNDIAIFRLSNTYGRTVTEQSGFKNDGIIDYVTSYINNYAELYTKNPKKAYAQFSDLDPATHTMISIRLNLKDGRKITRRIKFDDEHVKKLEVAIRSDKEYMKKFLAIPNPDKLNLKFDLEGMSESEAVEMYDCFLNEYNALSEEAKLDYLKNNLYTNYQDSYDTSYEGFYYDEEADSINSKTESVDTENEQAVSESDIPDTILVSKSCDVGDYWISQGYINQFYNEETDSFSIEIIGYAEGHLYEDNYFFDQNMIIDRKRFPKTCEFIVKTCNSHIPNALSRINKLNELTKSGQGKGDLSIFVNYCTAEDSSYIQYQFATASSIQFDKETYNEYWDGQVEAENAKIVTVDSNAMVKKLLSDASKGGSIDFSKPYCRVTIYGSDDHGFINNEFFVQTGLEIIS